MKGVLHLCQRRPGGSTDVSVRHRCALVGVPMEHLSVWCRALGAGSFGCCQSWHWDRKACRALSQLLLQRDCLSSSWHLRPQGQGHAVSLNLLRPLVTHGGYLTCWGAEIFTVGLSSVTKNQSHRTPSMHRIQLQALNLTVTSPASPTHFLPMWPS